MPLSEQDLNFMKNALPFWDKLKKDEQEKILKEVSVVTYKSGTILHKGSLDCTGVMVIKRGQLRVYLISDLGKEITLYRLFERDICIFSAACMLKNINFEVYIESEKETTVFLIPTAIYKNLMQSSLAVSDYSNQLISSRFSDVMWMIEQVLFMSFDRRLALFLIEQSNIENSDTLKITQETIARNMGSAREVVTRMIKYFQEEGLVKSFRGGIQITDRKGLEKLI